MYMSGFYSSGGLNPDNVAEAVRIVKPTVVDVSSGVTQECGIKKDHAKVTAFVYNAKSAFNWPQSSWSRDYRRKLLYTNSFSSSREVDFDAIAGIVMLSLLLLSHSLSCFPSWICDAGDPVTMAMWPVPSVVGVAYCNACMHFKPPREVGLAVVFFP